MSNNFIRFGFLSTLDNPLLPLFVEAARRRGVRNIVIICDSKSLSDKDKNIWIDRVGGFDSPSDGLESIYNFGSALIPIYLVKNHNDDISLELYRSLNVSCLFNAGTPRKLSEELICSIERGVVNVHPGLLPNYRGCSSIEWAIYNDDQIGSTAHFMDAGYDTGPIIQSEVYEFLTDDVFQSICSKVYRQGALLAGEVLASIQYGDVTYDNSSVQDEKLGVYRKPISSNALDVVHRKVATKNYKFQVL
jgi:methionyl-tRNA formyltransferase